VLVNKTLLKGLRKKYGFDEGTRIYYKMESEAKPGFSKGIKTATKEGHVQSGTRKKRGA